MSDNRFDQPRADFSKESFDQLVLQKGRKVLYEKALMCPCKSRGSDSQGTCRNCAGLGWMFVAPQEARMVISGMSIASPYKAWSEEERGMLNITSNEVYNLSFMDRVTILDSTSTFNEVLHFKLKGEDYFSYAIYKIKEIEFAGLFLNTGKQIKQIFVDQGDFYFEENRVFLSKELVEEYFSEDSEDISISLRYFHAPSYHIVENKRDTMDTFVVEGGRESNKKLPISAFARRAHYIPDMQNLNGTRLLVNDFKLADCSKNRDLNDNVFQSQFNAPFK